MKLSAGGKVVDERHETLPLKHFASGDQLQKKLYTLLERVRQYDENQSELQSSHHFMFCLPISNSKSSKRILLMGFNPGESDSDWRMTDGKRSEESFDYDFHQGKPGRSSKRWRSNVDYFIGDAEVFLTEFCFWSSTNVKQLSERIGSLTISNPHLRFCTTINTKLIAALKPNLVVFTGVSRYPLVEEAFKLRPSPEIESPGGKRLWIHATSSQCRWLFTRHWTGSFGFTQADRELVREEIQKLLQ